MTTIGLRVSIFWTLLTVAASASAQSGDAKIRIDGAWARRAPMLKSVDSKAGTGTGAVYAALVNAGKESDALVAAVSDAAEAVEIHESYQESGMMKMRPLARIDIPAGKSVEMKPGGYHIMLLNLTRDLEAGQVVQLTLVFQRAGKIPVTAQIK
jgi:periplasmic copper chaperone A